jgi:hypothetical protein
MVPAAAMVCYSPGENVKAPTSYQARFQGKGAKILKMKEIERLKEVRQTSIR